MNAHKPFLHWQVKTDANNIVWLGFDRKNSPVNTFNEEVVDELICIAAELAENKQTSGLIIHSCKKTGFIAGADISTFKDLATEEAAEAILIKGQTAFQAIEDLKIPTVAMINGFCMGGGTELVLACDYRVALNSDSTRIGLPEVRLGIHPGWGGSVRLPPLVGHLAAVDLMLTGRALRASAAKKIGLVDDAVPERQLKRAAIYFVNNKPAKQKASAYNEVFKLPFIRSFAANYMKKKVADKARQEHYPAPYAILDLWQRDGAEGKKAYQHEIDSFVKLVVESETSRNLVRVFFLQERMKQFAKNSDFKVKHLHVIGAGTMGGDIAAWCALRGIRVTLQDREMKFIAPAIARAHKLFKKRLKKPRLIRDAMDRLIPDVNGLGVKNADMIIEAIVENLEAKQTVFKDVEQRAKPSAILASNTSSIPLDEINSVLKNPERLVGIHFFNPVAQMQLVEVVKGAKTSDKTVADSCSFVGQISRLPLPVKSSPGFLVNRVLMPYLMEAFVCAQEGIPLAVIDEAALKFGMPMGPIELADVVGLDVCLSVAENLAAHFGGTVPEKLKQMVADGKLGKKSGQGFYKYSKGKAEKAQANFAGNDLEALGHRLILKIINESAACLREDIVEDADLLDAGMIFGTGFAPFRGGPMHYARSCSEGPVHDLLNSLGIAREGVS